MAIERIIETEDGIQDENVAQKFDVMQREIRDNGWMDESVNIMLEKGLNLGHALEVGQGPGYFGLEWLKATNGTKLSGIEISQAMLDISMKNAKEYQVLDRVDYHLGNAKYMDFKDELFDLVFTRFSLHEWDDPEKIFSEIGRVLKINGFLYIIDWRRDMTDEEINRLAGSVEDRRLREGFIKSVNAGYTGDEIKSFFSKEKNNMCVVEYKETYYGMYVIVKKQ